MSGGPAIVKAETVAVVVARQGRLPDGAAEVVAEAGGVVVVCGTDPELAVPALVGAVRVWTAATATAPGPLAARLAPALAATTLVVLPASPDGRDLAPRLASAMGRPLLAATVGCTSEAGGVSARVLRVEGRVAIHATTAGPAVVTLLPGSRSPLPAASAPQVERLVLEPPETGAGGGSEWLGDVEPDPATMELAAARRVLAGGAGLVDRNAPDADNRAVFDLLVEVATALRASSGATRVVTDAGWMGYDRQIGTTGVSIDPDLYVAFGVSGASQHVGGLGAPLVTVSVNSDPSCPMTAMADLGLVTDAPALLGELARRLGVGPAVSVGAGDPGTGDPGAGEAEPVEAVEVGS